MRKFGFSKKQGLVDQLKTRVNVLEWDFTQVPHQEEQACCYYEYARESSWLMEQMDNPSAVVGRKFENSLLTYALPPSRHVIDGQMVGRQKNFDGRPWLAQEPDWRQTFYLGLETNKNGLGYARILRKTPDRAFGVGITPHFPWQRWEDEHKKRLLDLDTGLEVILVTVDWETSKILKSLNSSGDG